MHTATELNFLNNLDGLYKVDSSQGSANEGRRWVSVAVWVLLDCTIALHVFCICHECSSVVAISMWYPTSAHRQHWSGVIVVDNCVLVIGDGRIQIGFQVTILRIV